MREKRHPRFAAFPIAKGVVSRKAMLSYRSLPHWGRGTAQRRSGALVNDALGTIFLALFHTASTLSGSLRSPPSPREEGFVSRKAVSSFRCLPHRGRGTASAVDRVLSQTTYLRRSFPLFFMPLVPYPARFARHLPHASPFPWKGLPSAARRGWIPFGAVKPPPLCLPIGKGVVSRKAVSSFRSLPHWGRGTAPAVDRVLS